MKTYIVGGAVRDRLMGLEPTDIDLMIVGATEYDINNLILDGYKQVGKDFPVYLHPTNGNEYALARVERSTGNGYNDFAVYTNGVSLEEDLYRRDLTINAMAIPEEHWEDNDWYTYIEDPFGGLDDINNKVLRHISEAFSEDPVRVLRAAKFYTRYSEFTIHKSTLAMMESLNDKLSSLVPERVTKELFSAMQNEKPSRFFEALRDSNTLEAIFPEVYHLIGVEQPKQYHDHDAYGHVMAALDLAAFNMTSLNVRIAVLCHDFGKGDTDPEKWPHHFGHENYGEPIVENFAGRLKMPKDIKNLALVVTKNHMRFKVLEEMRPKKVIKLLNTVGAYRSKDNLTNYIKACMADRMNADAVSYLLRCYHASKDISNEVQEHIESGKKMDDNARNHMRTLKIKDIRYNHAV